MSYGLNSNGRSSPDVMADALSKFTQQVIDLAQHYTAKEAARAVLVSTNFMRNFGEQMGITFASKSDRTPEDERRLRRQLLQLQEEAQIRRMKPILPSPGPDGLKLPPKLEALSRRALWERENKVVALLMEYAKTMTMSQVQKRTKLHQRTLRRLAYDHGIVFADQIGAFNEEAANAELLESARSAFTVEGLPAEAQEVISAFLIPRTRGDH